MPIGLLRLLRGQRAAWLTLALGLLATAAVGWGLHRGAVSMDRQRLAMRVAEVTAQLDARLEKSEMLLHNLRDYLMWSGENRSEVFARWCYENGLTINCPWLYGITVATNRNQAYWKDRLPNPPASWTPLEWNIFVELAKSQMVDCVLAMSSEFKDNVQVPSENVRAIRSFHERHPAANAIKGSRITMSYRAIRTQNARSNLFGCAVYTVPIYRSGVMDYLSVAGPTLEQQYAARWMHLASVIQVPVDFDALSRAVWDGVPADLGMELFDSTDQFPETWLSNSKTPPRAADPNFKAYLTHRQMWPMYGAKFSIFFHTTPLFEAQSPRRFARIAVAAGTALTLLASALVAVATRARNRQERLTEQIREARDALAAAQQERNKFSRDLHDGTIQSLYAIQLGLGRTVEKLETNPARAGRELSEVRRELDGVIAEIRRFITTEAATGKFVDFAAVLHALVQRARTGTAAQITLQCDPAASKRLTGDQAVQLANIAREALSNSLRHAKPQRVKLALRSNCETLILEIYDDGNGFDPEQPGASGVGLTSMRARTQEMRGTLEIQSAPGKGTQVVVGVPAASPEATGSSQTGADDEP